MRGDVLVDLRNVYLPAQARAAGFRYTRLGSDARNVLSAKSDNEIVRSRRYQHEFQEGTC